MMHNVAGICPTMRTFLQRLGLHASAVCIGDDYILTRGVSHCGLAIFIKNYLKAKEGELLKLKYFTMQKYNLQKILEKKPKSLKIL
jgi:hypothetical protein